MTDSIDTPRALDTLGSSASPPPRLSLTTPAGLQSIAELTRRRRLVLVLNVVTYIAMLWVAARILGAGGWTLVDKIPMSYNVGHITAVEGDTVTPQGKFLIGLNKWAIDRFFPVGPLHPQNFQLVDIAAADQPMRLLYDAPVGIGEPHYAQTMRAEKIQAWTAYPEVGWDPIAQAKSPTAVAPGSEGVVRDGNKVTVNMTSVRSHLTPDQIELKAGDEVTWHITNIELAQDATHGFALPGANVNLSIEPGEATTLSFIADTPGVYPFYCTEFCSALHLEMMGYLLVSP